MLRVVAILLSLFAVTAQAGPARTSAAAAALPFFAMDTALRDGRVGSATEQATLLKKLGFDGIGASGYPPVEFFEAFEKLGLRVFNTYLTLDFDSAKPNLDEALGEFIPRLKSHRTDLWIAINRVTRDGHPLRTSDPMGDAIVAPLLQELAEAASQNGSRIALYPHTGQWLERAEDALRLARAANRENVGVTFNLCHWLKVEGDRDPRPFLREALPRLFFVTINGTETGDTRQMSWKELIQPLDAGAFDVRSLVRFLNGIGYSGAIGFQGYGIPGDSRDILARTMQAWRGFSVR